MIAVSDSFKKAIKSENREIHGYVEVEYQNKSFDTSILELPTHSEIVSDNGIINGDKILQKYATLEPNYTLLDGSFMVWNENVVLENGYISNNVFDDINNATIIIENNSTNLSTKGITIYFKENLPFDFTVTMTTTDEEDIVDNVTNNQSYVYQYIFNEEQYISSITLNIERVEFSNHRLKIAYIDFNISDLYEGDELVSFEVTEELDLLLENVPTNTCTVNLNNYPDERNGNKFDIINPKGITNYLTEDTILKPYIGVLTESNGIEYVPMGTFYLDDWSSDSDGNVTFDAYTIINKFKGRQMIVDTDFLLDPVNAKLIGNMIKNQVNVDVDFPDYSFPWLNDNLRDTDLYEYVSHVMPSFLYYDSPYDDLEAEFRKFYVNRYGVITLDKIDNTIVDSIERTFLKSDLDYTVLNGLKYLNIKSIAYGSNNIADITILNENHTLNSEEEYVWFIKDNYLISTLNSFNYSVTSGSGTASLVGYGRFLILVKFTGTIGSVIRITCNVRAGTTTSTTKNVTIANNIDYGDTIDIDLSDYYYVINPNILKTIYFTLPKKYKITADTMGDPSLETGDTISVQTRYTDINNGYKDIIVTKQQFTFDGGLQCSLEGVGN